MPINENFVSKIKEVLVSGQLMLNEPMKDHTTFKIGGPVDYLILPASVTEVQQVFILLKEYGIPYTVLGNGSNVLVRDKGVRGAIVKFNSPFSGIRLEENRIFAGAGASLKDVSLFAAEHGLTGMEFAIGIPGSVGGAVFMLGDFAFAVASNYGKQPTVSTTSQISFLRAAKGNRLTARAECVRAGRTSVYYEISVWDEPGNLIARMTAGGAIVGS